MFYGSRATLHANNDDRSGTSLRLISRERRWCNLFLWKCTNNSGDDPKHQKLKSDWTEIRWYWNELISFIYESSKRKKKKIIPKLKLIFYVMKILNVLGFFSIISSLFLAIIESLIDFFFRKGTSLFSSMNKAWRRIKDEKDQCSYHTKISSFQITLQNSFKRMWNNCTLHWYCCEEFPKWIKSAKMEKKSVMIFINITYWQRKNVSLTNWSYCINISLLNFCSKNDMP